MREVKSRAGIENGRAAYAFAEVKKVVGDSARSKKEYRSYVKKVPSLIQVNGLGQTMAFCFQKKKEYQVIYEQIHVWLKKEFPEHFSGEPKEFIEVVVNLNSTDYRAFTMETLALLNWMRKFADGMIKD